MPLRSTKFFYLILNVGLRSGLKQTSVLFPGDRRFKSFQPDHFFLKWQKSNRARHYCFASSVKSMRGRRAFRPAVKKDP